MNKLIEGYENRIKDFLYKMAEKPIIIKKNDEMHMTTRQELYASSSNKILYKKGFIFNSFKSDKQRINELLKNKELLEKYLAKNRRKNKEKELAKKLKQIHFIQPSMHFMKRKELEKIYDILQKKDNLNTAQKQLYNQMKEMGFNTKKNFEYEYEDSNDENIGFLLGGNYNSTNNIYNEPLNEEDKYKKLLHNKILNERKNMLIKRKLILNLGNKIKKFNNKKSNQENDFQKTHFKAMENLKMFKTSTMNHQLFKTWSTQDLAKQNNLNEYKKIFYKTISSNFPKFEKKGKKRISLKKKIFKNIKDINIKDNNEIINEKLQKDNNDKDKNSLFNIIKYNEFNLLNSNIRKNIFNSFDNEKILKDSEITNEIMSLNPLLFKLNFSSNLKYKNNNFNNKIDSPCFFDKLKMLKKIAFENNDEINAITSSKISNERTDTFFDELKKEEDIVIDGKYYKKTDTDKIASKVLKKCNYNNNKVDYKNMEGRGKLMFTNGLTVKEFEIKYGIIP